MWGQRGMWMVVVSGDRLGGHPLNPPTDSGTAEKSTTIFPFPPFPSPPFRFPPLPFPPGNEGGEEGDRLVEG